MEIRIKVCECCFYTAVDGYFDNASGDEVEATTKGIETFSEKNQELIPVHDEPEFLINPCECCHTKLHGERYELIVYQY